MSETVTTPAKVEALIALRRAERQNFYAALLDPQVVKDSEARSEHFRALLDLALHDYGVNSETIADTCGVSHKTVLDWALPRENGGNPAPANIRAVIIDAIAVQLRKSLGKEAIRP